MNTQPMMNVKCVQNGIVQRKSSVIKVTAFMLQFGDAIIHFNFIIDHTN